MATIAITGSSGGIGRACRERLEKDGHRVIGIDARDGDVTGDLSTSGGRRAALSHLDDHCGGELDALVVTPPPPTASAATVVSIGFFGAVAALDGAQPLLVGGASPSVVVITSNGSTTRDGYPLEVAEWCLAGDETRARQWAGEDAAGARAATDLATALWVRRNAPGSRWMGSDIRLNVIASGPVDVDLPDGRLPAEELAAAGYPTPQDRPARATEVAALTAFLAGDDGAHFCGSVLTMDGGTEAALRADAWPRPFGH